MEIDLTTHQKTIFHEDGFLIVEKLIDPKTLPRLHQAFDDLFNGVFESGVRPDEVNWQQGKSDPSWMKTTSRFFGVRMVIAHPRLRRIYATQIVRNDC